MSRDIRKPERTSAASTGAPIKFIRLPHTVPPTRPYGLSEAQYRVMWAVCHFGSAARAAFALQCSPRTLENHCANARVRMEETLGKKLDGMLLYLTFDRWLHAAMRAKPTGPLPPHVRGTHGPAVCTRCGQSGHVAASCPLPIEGAAHHAEAVVE